MTGRMHPASPGRLGSPSSVFSKKSMDNYAKLRKIVTKMNPPEGFVYIPGRSAHVDKAYIEVRYGYGLHAPRRRFYFTSKPKGDEVRQIVALLCDYLRAETDETEVAVYW